MESATGMKIALRATAIARSYFAPGYAGTGNVMATRTARHARTIAAYAGALPVLIPTKAQTSMQQAM